MDLTKIKTESDYEKNVTTICWEKDGSKSRVRIPLGENDRMQYASRMLKKYAKKKYNKSLDAIAYLLNYSTSWVSKVMNKELYRLDENMVLCLIHDLKFTTGDAIAFVACVNQKYLNDEKFIEQI